MQKYNYGNFLWQIKEKYNTKKAFCEAAGITTKTLQNYLEGVTPMPADFIEKACQLLDIHPEEIGAYFFTPSAEKMTQGAT